MGNSVYLQYVILISSMKKMKSGFTLLEILLVVAAIAILAGIVIVAINPGKQLADTRNAQRRSDVTTILNAIYQYSVDNSGNLPAGIPTGDTCATPATNEICKTGAAACTNLVDLTPLTTNQEYLVSLPSDPSGATTNGGGYHVTRSTNGRVTVCAPDAEQGATIQVVR